MLRRIVLISAICFSLIATALAGAQDSRFVTVSLPDYGLATINSLTATISDIGAERVRELVFDTLVIRNRQLDHVGHLASRIEVLNDGRTLNFHLRDNVKFHNGKQLQASDVVYTLNEMLKSKGFKAGAFFETVDGKQKPHLVDIKATNELTVTITISRSEVKELLLSNLTSIPIIPYGSIEQIATAPIGSGPFKFEKVDLASGIIDLAANPDYWDGPPTIQTVRLKRPNTTESVLSGLSDGSLDIAFAGSYAPSSFYDSVAKLPRVQTYHFPGSNIWYLGFNTTSKHLRDVRLRKAIAFAIDQQKIVDLVSSGRGAVAHSILPPQSSTYSEGVRYETDLLKSRRLLKEARYSGKKISIKLTQSSEHNSRLAQAIQKMLASAGINAELEFRDPGQLRAQLRNGEFDMNIGMWVGGNQDPLFFKDLFSTSGIPGNYVACCNRGRFSDAKVDLTIEQARSTDDVLKKRELYRTAWDLISEKVPMMPLYHPAIVVVANKRIGNINPSPTGDWRFIKDLTVDNN